MALIRPGIRRLFDLMLRRRDLVTREVDDEISFHLDLRAEQLRLGGVTAEEARREALRRFGTLHLARPTLEDSAIRRARRMAFREWMETTFQDVRYALRGLRREPVFTGFAIATLALGIGANAAVYGVVDRLLISGPDHVEHPERLVRFTATVPRSGFGEATSGSFGYVTYARMKESARAFDGVAAYATGGTTLGRGRDARRVSAGFATADFFPLLGVRPALGRFYQPDEDRPADPERVIVLGDAYWHRQFGADPGVLGRTIDSPDGPYTVIGVAPPGFTGVDLQRIDAWIPMSVYSRDVTNNWPTAWNAQWLHVVGRLKDGLTRAAASAEATRAHLASYDGPPGRSIAQARFAVVPISYTENGTEGSVASVSRWLLGVTAVILLIACTNVSNLLLARAVRRRGEVGVRLALGAARSRLARLFFTESLLLAALGGAAALLVAAAISTTVRTSLLASIEWTTPPVSQRVLGVALGVSLLVGVLVGLAPAMHAARGSLMSAIQRGHGSGRRLGLGAWPTVLQACLTAMLLVGAGLFTRSFQRARHVPLGFDSERVVVAHVQWAGLGDVDSVARAAARARREDTWRRALQAARTIPGVEHASLAVGSPFGSSFAIPIFVTGWDSIPHLEGGGPYVSAVTDGYFATVGTRVLRGRAFQPQEGAGTEPLAIVNETMARTLWPDVDAIGQCIRMWESTAPCSRVVGVVEDARRYELREPATMQYYIPLGQGRGFGGTVMLARARGSTTSILTPLQATIEATDATVERAAASPLRNEIDPLLRPWRLGATIFGLGGALALLIAALGMYSVMSYSVAQRTHELGVRIALGASSPSIVSLVMRQSIAMAGAGLAAGLVITWWLGPRVETLLFETSAHDPAVIGTAILVLIAAAIVASLLPALRARSVDPMRTLRTD